MKQFEEIARTPSTDYSNRTKTEILEELKAFGADVESHKGFTRRVLAERAALIGEIRSAVDLGEDYLERARILNPDDVAAGITALRERYTFGLSQKSNDELRRQYEKIFSPVAAERRHKAEVESKSVFLGERATNAIIEAKREIVVKDEVITPVKEASKVVEVFKVKEVLPGVVATKLQAVVPEQPPRIIFDEGSTVSRAVKQSEFYGYTSSEFQAKKPSAGKLIDWENEDDARLNYDTEKVVGAKEVLDFEHIETIPETTKEAMRNAFIEGQKSARAREAIIEASSTVLEPVAKIEEPVAIKIVDEAVLDKPRAARIVKLEAAQQEWNEIVAKKKDEVIALPEVEPIFVVSKESYELPDAIIAQESARPKIDPPKIAEKTPIVMHTKSNDVARADKLAREVELRMNATNEAAPAVTINVDVESPVVKVKELTEKELRAINKAKIKDAKAKAKAEKITANIQAKNEKIVAKVEKELAKENAKNEAKIAKEAQELEAKNAKLAKLNAKNELKQAKIDAKRAEKVAKEAAQVEDKAERISVATKIKNLFGRLKNTNSSDSDVYFEAPKRRINRRFALAGAMIVATAIELVSLQARTNSRNKQVEDAIANTTESASEANFDKPAIVATIVTEVAPTTGAAPSIIVETTESPTTTEPITTTIAPTTTIVTTTIKAAVAENKPENTKIVYGPALSEATIKEVKVDPSDIRVEKVIRENGYQDSAGRVVVAIIKKAINDPGFEAKLASNGLSVIERTDGYKLGKSAYDLNAVDARFADNLAQIIADLNN